MMSRVEATGVRAYTRIEKGQSVTVFTGIHPETKQQIYAVIYPDSQGCVGNCEIGFVEGGKLEVDPFKMLLG